MNEFWAAVMGAAVGGVAAAIGGFIVAEWSVNRRIRHQLYVISRRCDNLSSLFANMDLRAESATFREASRLRQFVGILETATDNFIEFIQRGPSDWEPMARKLSSYLNSLTPLIGQLSFILKETRILTDTCLSEAVEQFDGRGGVQAFEAMPMQPELFETISTTKGSLSARSADLANAKRMADEAAQDLQWWTVHL